MPNSERWAAWLALLAQSDAALVQLATMAACAVLIWEMLRRVPEPWRNWLRSAYLIGLLAVYTYFVTGGK